MEIRGVWITKTDSKVLNSKQNIAEAMNLLADTGFNVVFPVVWSNSATLYPSQIMRENFGIEIDQRYVGRDPLLELVVEAQRVGIAVIPWFEYGFASSYAQNGGLILEKQPQWAARDRAGNLLKKNNFEWMNALDFEVQDFMLSLVLEVAKYDVAGIQGDDRLPALPSEGGYDQKTIERYQKQFNQVPPDNPKEAQWLQWRADILTDFLARLYHEVIAINPNLVISMSPSPYIWGYQEYLQDSKAWIDRGLVDIIHPQLYRRDFQGYKQLIDIAIQQFSQQQMAILAPGVLLKAGSYHISPEYLLQAIAYNRSRNIQGEVFFFYEGLREENNVAVLKDFYKQPVPFDSKQIKQRSFTNRRIGGKYSYIDKAGKLSIQPQFDEADGFSEGLARVKLGYKWGYIDKNGEVAIRLQFDSAEPFLEGLALVKVNGKYGYINNTGNLAITLQFDDANSFSQGLAPVKVVNKWGYINNRGEVVIKQQFDGAERFSEGLALVKVNGKYSYIDRRGKIVSTQFQFAKSFHEGLAAVQNAGKFGYIDRTGKLVILAIYNDAERFSEGLAAVKIDNKWGYIDKAGQVIIPFQFDSAKPFYEGLALVNSGGKWGYIKNIK